MSIEKGQKMTLKMSTEGNKIPLNFIMRVITVQLFQLTHGKDIHKHDLGLQQLLI